MVPKFVAPDTRLTPDKDETGVSVTTTTNEMAMIQFAKNYGPDVEILKPDSLREKVKAELAAALKCYE